MENIFPRKNKDDSRLSLTTGQLTGNESRKRNLCILHWYDTLYIENEYSAGCRDNIEKQKDI